MPRTVQCLNIRPAHPDDLAQGERGFMIYLDSWTEDGGDLYAPQATPYDGPFADIDAAIAARAKAPDARPAPARVEVYDFAPRGDRLAVVDSDIPAEADIYGWADSEEEAKAHCSGFVDPIARVERATLAGHPVWLVLTQNAIDELNDRPGRRL